MPDRSKAPEVKPFGRLNVPEENVMTLPNGLMLHVFSGGDQDVARLTLISEGGSSDTDNPCAATFAAELMREGSSTFTGEQVADIMDFNGAWLNCSSSGHYSTMQLFALTSKLSVVLPVAIDCFADPSYPRTAFEAIRRKTAAKQRQNLSRVSFLANADNKRLICGSDHRDSRIIEPEEIEETSIEEVRAFHDRTFDAGLTHAYLCGRVDVRLADYVARTLGEIPLAGRQSPISIVPYAAAMPGISTVGRPGSLQCAVTMSLPAIAREHPDYNDLRMTVTALGGYFGSRLMQNVREDKGYTYGISASLFGSREGSYVSINAQCDNSYAKALMEEVRNEVGRMAAHPLDDAEMHRLKFNVSTDLASTLDSPFSIMDYYELQRLVGTPRDYFESRQKSLGSLTAERVCEISRMYLDPSEFRTSVAGDLDKTGGI